MAIVTGPGVVEVWMEVIALLTEAADLGVAQVGPPPPHHTQGGGGGEGGGKAGASHKEN